MTDETVGFDKIDTASRVREVIKKLARQTVANEVPTKNIGRVMSVDLPRLRATVWFPNDEQPIEVRLLSSVIPGEWQHKSATNGGYDSLSGYGSQAVVQRLNGSLYITEVLTGGQFSFDLRTMNHSIVAQKATPTSAGNTTSIEPIVDQPLETFINCRVVDSTINEDQAIEFGPFTQYYSGQPGIGFIEMTVALSPNRGTKYYKFVVNPAQEFDHPGSTGILDSWFRIMSEHSIADSAGTIATAADWDLDISYKRTAYGNTSEYAGYPEIWFRIVKRSTWTGGLDALVTLRATNIQKARSLGGRELFMQEKRTGPTEIHGHLGFHNSKHLFRDTDDYALFDNYGRVTLAGTGWQTSDSGQVWSGTTGMNVDGVSGVMSHTAANQTFTARINDNQTQVDGTWVVWVEQVALGAEFQTQGIFRFLDQNNKVAFKVIFDLLGVVKLSVIESYLGVHNFVGSDVTMPFTYAANTKIRVRVKITTVGAYYFKAWLDGTREPETWTKTGSIPNITGGTNYGYGFQNTTGGANSNPRPSNIHFAEAKLYVANPTLDNGGAQWHTGPWRSGLLRVASDVQKAFTTSVAGWGWDGSRVKWYVIFLHGPGPHRNGLAVGRSNLEMPDVGATIPVVPNGTTVTVNSSGIPLAPEQALYCAIPPGSDWRDLGQFLFIVDGTSTRDYQLPEWAVLIASRGPSGNAVFAFNARPELKLGDGSQLDSWHALPFRGGWSDYGGQWQGAQYRMEPGNVVRLRGLFKANAATVGTPSIVGVFADMPTFFSPPLEEVFHTIASGSGLGAARIEVFPDGRLETPQQMNGGGALWISLAGITWVANM
jgi:hypothetical protein